MDSPQPQAHGVGPSQSHGGRWTATGTFGDGQTTCASMPTLEYLADTNVISDWMSGAEPVLEWLGDHREEVAIRTFTLAELQRGIELKQDGKARRELERQFRFILQDYDGCIWVFDEAAAFEWGRLMAEARNHPIPYDDSLIAAIARSMNAMVVTRNVRHFPGCQTVDPWTDRRLPAWRPAND